MDQLQSLVLQIVQIRRGWEVITFEESLDIVRENAALLPTEHVSLAESLNRVLREDVISDMDMPPFDKSAVDGFACRKQDIGQELAVVGTIAAGSQVTLKVEKNQCAKIMTGAVMPTDADCVLMVEEVEFLTESRIWYKGDKPVPNICYKGEDVIAGDKLLSSGSRITPKEIASLAVAGCANPVVSRMPRVGVFATGNEIVEPAIVPQLSQIRNSNSYQLISHAKQFGCDVTYYGIARDSNEAISSMIRKAKRENDLLLLTGGVSMGELDLVPALLEGNGFKILFRGVSIQPGRPTVFGRSEDSFVFGIPGNPVASFIVFETIVKELLAAMMGLTGYRKVVVCRLGKGIQRQKTRRLGWRPVKISPDGTAFPLEYHGTAHITAYANADGIIPIPVGISEVAEGSPVEVWLI
jgi:molybdopterin molybdotransferase